MSFCFLALPLQRQSWPALQRAMTIISCFLSDIKLHGKMLGVIFGKLLELNTAV